MIAAVAENLAIGKDNQLLWHLPEDLKRFKKITLGHPVIMGKNTYESIGKPLSGRTNIIISDVIAYKAPGCIVVNSFEDAIKEGKEHDKNKIFIIGGGMVYKQGIKIADKLYITLVKGNFQADIFFPEYSNFTKVISRKEGKSGKYKYTFLELEKNK